jgi:DNA topoisomerase I
MVDAEYCVSKIKHGERRRKPYAPYITSTLQQDAARRLGYTAKRTMALAQQLYEGLDIGEKGETAGLITYMRTDSTHISEVAQKEVRDYILNTYGKDYLPDSIPSYRTRVKGAQEAHEAIRPTSTLRLPDRIKSHLTRDQFRLYKLIWQRFVASQMESAVFDTVMVEVSAKTDLHQYLLRASGSTLRFAGFLTVYEVTPDEDQAAEKNITIPAEVIEGQVQALERLIPEQHSTQPPPRYSEATLVQELEENGIGRPSTYAPTLSTIQQRGYVARENKRLFPTETGCLVNDLLVEHFSEVVNLQFTASMEEDLDQIAVGDRKWVDVVQSFYDKFEPQVTRAQEEMPTQKAELEKVGRQCPKCERDLVIRWGRFGKFISCSGFPECRYTEPWLEKIGVQCPDCDGEIVQRRSRKGRVFYGCSNYPECQFTSWKRPVSPPCPNCSGLLVISNKREVKCLKCEETFLIEKFENLSTQSA